ncbi:MAG: hypothetical protein HQM12_22425, partial [SAR324 cluster bacterium]|nr:hypothetical protein [SAR324 cluster bacterium]
IAVDVDLEKFFDNGPHDVLMAEVSKKVHDKRVLRLIRWTEKVEKKFKERVRQITSRSRGVSMEQVIAELSTYLRGWINTFGLSDYYRPIPGLDNWIRRRVRMCYWKQWKRPKTRIRTLLKLGTNRKHAVSTGRSSKGYWRLSKTLATQSGMTNLWLAHQGLVSLKNLWILLAPLR